MKAETKDRRETFEHVLRQVGWLKEVIDKRGWDLTQDLVLEGPVTAAEIQCVEEELGLAIPEECKELFRFARRLEFRYEYDEETPAEFRNNFSGEIGWNLGQLKKLRESLAEWVEILSMGRDDPASAGEAAQLWAGKVPLTEAANGDIILVGGSPCEVVYFSCREYAMHGRKLGNSLWEFLRFHAGIGFAGGYDWQLEPFYDLESDEARVKEESAGRFAEWLRKG
ncbi:SMI1/KNR4 family protein [Pontibacter harenae]|uniref:SMI1/KNR4 family protein n=1 Tax=Pontibacter harenae TaxID=2894083 RepID=UPI001E5BAA20|nr:SMI1/KNR4 family protein [Pontibacter harenae]MCC9168924.1 hypothetical protein [Pontibacter harenae]